MQDLIADRSWPVLLKVSWQAAVLIVLVLAVQWALGPRLSPRWRFGLWLLVVVRLALPWTISSSVSLFNYLSFSNASAMVAHIPPFARSQGDAVLPVADSFPDEAPVPMGATPAPAIDVFSWLPLVWAAGVAGLGLCLIATHFRLWRRVTPCRPLTDPDVMNLLEDCKQLMGVRVPMSLVETPAVDAPCLFGFVRPRLLLPPGFTRGFSPDELRHVFLHELGHVKRRDIPLGWLMAVLQILHWFNPLVWLAFSRIRTVRELACDELALSHAGVQGSKPYGRTIVKLLESFGNSLRVPSLAGIVESKQQMKERITMIAKFQGANRGPVLAALLFLALGLFTLTEAQPTAGQTTPAPAAKSGAPRIVATSPKNGAINVGPATLTEISVTFDQDMQGGMSWTGGGPEFPAMRVGEKARWTDKRTCVLPVKVETAHRYRVGINSPSYRNFRSAAGVPADATAIIFTTIGAAADLNKPTDPPAIVSTSPTVGATEVDPSITEITVTFDQDMQDGMSWTGGGPDFPPAREGQKAHWLNKRTCVLPVKIEAAHYYRVGINSKSYLNFASAHGAAALPSAIFFTTTGASQALKARTRLPQAIRFEPVNGAQNLSTSVRELRITFSVPMGDGFSWCTAGDDDHDFPKGREGVGAHWLSDHKTCVKPVTLAPGMTYRLILNAPGYNNFQSDAGVPLEPVSYTFKTSDKP